MPRRQCEDQDDQNPRRRPRRQRVEQDDRNPRRPRFIPGVDVVIRNIGGETVFTNADPNPVQLHSVAVVNFSRETVTYMLVPANHDGSVVSNQISTQHQVYSFRYLQSQATQATSLRSLLPNTNLLIMFPNVVVVVFEPYPIVGQVIISLTAYGHEIFLPWAQANLAQLRLNVTSMY